MVLFSHNIAMVITMLRKTGGLLTKDDADFVDAGYCLETSLQQPLLREHSERSIAF